MKKIISSILVILFVLAGLEVIGISNDKTIENFYESDFKGLFDDISVYRYQTACQGKVPFSMWSIDALYTNSENVNENLYFEQIHSIGFDRDYPIGEIIWQYLLTIYDPSPKAIAPIEDINGDGISDVIVCSEDDHVRCFGGGAIGTGVVLWGHEIYAGDVYNQNGLDIIDDVDGDGYEDVVVGAAWGARLIRCISGIDGSTIWTHDTHEYGGGGWVYMVNCSYDYDGDGVKDVLATCGDDSSDTGPKRVYCLDGEDGVSIWERPLGGPGFSVIGVEDFTGDGIPDVVAGCSNEAETIGYAKGINGDTGAQVWSKTASGSSVWALEQIEDITGDGIKDVIIGDFSGNIYGLDATDGGQEYSTSIGTAIITRFAKLNDVDYSGHPEIVPAHSSIHTTQLIDAEDGSIIWSHGVADQPWNVARISDVSGDGIDDVLVGTLYNSNYCYFLDGTNGSELETIAYGQAVDAINAIPDVVADGSMEMVAGGRDGKIVCFSGGLNAFSPNVEVEADFKADITEGKAPLTVHFTDLSIAENTTITSWEWDFDNDDIIDSEEQNPVWTYTEGGIYTVSLTVSDGTIFDTETKADYIAVSQITLEIGDITGGLFNVNAVIKNTGTIEATGAHWRITLEGGFILLGRNTSGENLSITAGGEETVSSKLILGFGQTTVTVEVWIPDGPSDTREQGGFVIIFFIKVNPGGI
ncbi:PDK repeat-containing protein [Thermoplasmatales archaeon SCGC AB-540-F20]|nr:PDK repeat-containing protein [Thermoplasmatales archaeon SCGC AB-540-F20]